MPLCAKSEFIENVEEYLDAITSEKYIISNFNETRETDDSDKMTKLRVYKQSIKNC